MQLVKIQIEQTDIKTPYHVFICKKEGAFYTNSRKIAAFSDLEEAENYASTKKNCNYIGLFFQSKEVAKEEVSAILNGAKTQLDDSISECNITSNILQR